MSCAATSLACDHLIDLPAPIDPLPDAPLALRNGLADHPLFEPARIKQLLRSMPRQAIEVRAVETTDGHDGSYRRGPNQPDADPVEAYERLEERPTWILVHDSWLHDADFGALTRQYIAELAQRLPSLAEGVFDIGCWLFLSSGRSVVHFHADPDQSFLNQIRGSKTVFVYPAAILPAPQIEDLIVTQDQKSVTYDPSYEELGFEPVHLGPGESVFLPLYAPHRVVNDEGLSVSFNVGFHTVTSRRQRAVWYVNRELRRLGLVPTPVGDRPWADAWKRRAEPLLRAKNKLARTIRGGR